MPVSAMPVTPAMPGKAETPAKDVTGANARASRKAAKRQDRRIGTSIAKTRAVDSARKAVLNGRTGNDRRGRPPGTR